ncbi:ergothioneine biosynthesis protein EgtB [Mucilaginibacter sp. PAMB04168]|uniref:ergothioneine biosynthesis protein EgtB n=1 Tax=Mucilaginibacter sp. PAMB04168 TaxID=3138567 RepID=UPI0031F6F8EF
MEIKPQPTQIFSDIRMNYRVNRQRTEEICKHLELEDYVVQPIADVSPPKWHLGHTSWFFETFILKPYVQAYQEFNAEFNFVFNSYYEAIGKRVIRTDRGNLSRPTVMDVYKYRRYVDNAMDHLLKHINNHPELLQLVITGLNHEQQHQELLLSDIKYILGHNPLFPVYHKDEAPLPALTTESPSMITINEGIYEIGYKGEGFYWDNEKGLHKVYLKQFEISDRLVTNGEFMQFINDGGYKNFEFWHAEGWEWVNSNQIYSPLYWHLIEGQWMNYSFRGLEPVRESEPVCHVSYYEAYAYAAWRGMRLPTEFEWETAANRFSWGERWEWTASAYLPYPDFTKAEGTLGEYNGKFMINQQVLRGASEATPLNHSRRTYRNFFQTHQRWQFTGIRLAQ